MIVELTGEPPDRIEADALIVFTHADDRPPVAAAGLLDWRLNGALSRLVKDGWYGAGRAESLLLATSGRARAPRVLVMGLGPRGGSDAARLREAGGAALGALASAGASRIVVGMPPPGEARLGEAERATAVVEGMLETARASPPATRPHVVLAVPLEAQADAVVALGALRAAQGAGYHLDLRPLPAARPGAAPRASAGLARRPIA